MNDGELKFFSDRYLSFNYPRNIRMIKSNDDFRHFFKGKNGSNYSIIISSPDFFLGKERWIIQKDTLQFRTRREVVKCDNGSYLKMEMDAMAISDLINQSVLYYFSPCITDGLEPEKIAKINVDFWMEIRGNSSDGSVDQRPMEIMINSLKFNAESIKFPRPETSPEDDAKFFELLDNEARRLKKNR